MDTKRDWSFIQKSMEIEGYIISDEELAQIAATYEDEEHDELVLKAIREAKRSGRSALQIAAELINDEENAKK